MPATYVFDGKGNIVAVEPDPRPLDEQRQERIANLANERWQQTQTMTFDGVLTAADPAHAIVDTAINGRVRFGVTERTVWKLGEGEYRLWGTEDLATLQGAILIHVQACFNREAELAAAIMTAKDADELDAITFDGWPEK